MKKIFSLLIVVLMATTSLFADDITADQALQIANKFATSPVTQKLSKRRVPVAEATPILAHTLKSKVADKDNAYVVNLSNDLGFVIVSGETGTGDEILGYCDHGSFDYDKAPVQLKDLLAFYTEAIDSLRLNPAKAAPRKAAQQWPSYLGSIRVGPLLTTTWSQEAPYNKYCPAGCPTGCTATAVAQVMYYWKWPKESKGVVNGEDFSGHVYDWDNMCDSYVSGYSEAQADAVARLMADIGKAMGMTYTPTGSSAAMSDMALVSNFGYEPGSGVETASTASALQNTLRSELNNRRPVLYVGNTVDEPGGHALVVDGYTSNDYFHFNFGWGGYYDGFYKNALVKMYNRHAQIMTNVRPYDAVEKEIGDIRYGLFKETGIAEILEYTKGTSNSENGTFEIPSTITDDEGNTYQVTSIRQQAFFRKGHFDKVIVGDNIKVVDPFSFFYTKVDTVVLSDKLEAVPDDAFAYTYIRHLTIGRNIKRIGKRAFYLCYLDRDIICKSPAFEVDDEAFAHTKPVLGDWIGCITRLGRQAFTGAAMERNPQFTNLEVIGDSAFYGARLGSGTPMFMIGPKVREISQSAFEGWGTTSVIGVDERNPYYSVDEQSNIYNKNKTSLVLAFRTLDDADVYPSTLVRLEPGCIRSNIIVPYIPSTVVDMEGAFKDYSKSLSQLFGMICASPIPPVITDATFNDIMFESDPDLHVPEGTEELYANAPGWRRFPNIVGDQEYIPLSDQGLQYSMVVNSTDDGKHQRISMPLSEIRNMEISDDGQHVIIHRNGKDDLTTSVVALDSISWAPGFVYEGAEVFELNDSTLTAEAQKCKVTFDATVIDDDVQLCVRNLVLTPNVTEGVTRGYAVDLSLSDGTHELSGTADITIPVSPGSNEKVCAAYYNETTGQWEPVRLKYNKDLGTATITTDHLSLYSVFYVTNEISNLAEIRFFEASPEWHGFEDATKILLDVISSDDPDKEMIRQFKDEMSLWQAVGLDGLYNVITSVSDPLLNFKPEAIDNAVTAMGYVGIALTILDVVGADIRGDNVGVAAGTLNSILSFSTGQMAAAIGTPIMSASMGCTAFITIALNKFGEMVQNRIQDLAYNAYYYYYSKSGKYDSDVKSNYRSPKDWYNYFYPVVVEGKLTKEKLDAYIEQSVRLYCNDIWTKNYDVWSRCCEVAKLWTPAGTAPDLTPSLKEKLSNQQYSELMNGVLVSVFTAIKKHLSVEGENRFCKSLEKIGENVNTHIVLRYKDSSRQGTDKSKYAGWNVRLTDAEGIVSNPQKFQCRIADDGRGSQIVSIYSLLQNGLRTNLTLADPNDVDQKTFDFDIPDGKGKVYITIDLDKGGTKVDTQPLEGLELAYDPATVSWPVYLGNTGNEDDYHMETDAIIALDNSLNKRARFQKEIERFFNRHDFITVDNQGNYRIGDDITGKFVDNGLTATGKFIIDVSNTFTEQTIHQFVKLFNSSSTSLKERIFDSFLLNGIIQHRIECEYTLTRASVDSKEFDVSYKGTGAYALLADVITKVTGVDADALMQGSEQTIYVDNLTTRQINGDGSVTLKYSTKLK